MTVNTLTIPKDPGIYMFKDSSNKIIYVGKAKNLKNRVSSYFRKDNSGSVKTEFLKRQIKDVEFFIMPNEKDALILENKMIKKHNPKYNIRLKDAKTYSYIALTNEQYPRMITTRRIPKKGEYFGPYTEGMKRRETMLLAQKIFNLRTCRVLPKRACLNFHIGLCSAPCISNITREDYQKQVEKASRFLKGETKETETRLLDEMKIASAEQKYETALEKRNQIEAISILKEKQSVEYKNSDDWDVWAIITGKEEITIEIFNVRKGVISGKKSYNIDSYNDSRRQFLTQYYSQKSVPKEIVLSEEIWEDNHEKESIEEYLKELRGKETKLIMPQRGEKKRLLEITIKNALQRTNIISSGLKLQETLNLAYPPRTIECFDMSNLQGEAIVGGMTRWINGEPDKEGYRRFEIKTSKGKPDDFAAMKEAVYRRYKRLQDEGKEMPDLILIDGGKGQLNSSLDSLKELGLQIPIIGLAKREEEIYIPEESEPIKLNPNKEPLLYLRRIRDNTHRFVITYNRKKRQMNFKSQTKDSLK